MKNALYFLMITLSVTACKSKDVEKKITVVTGVSDSLAHFRKSNLSNIQYTLHFNISENSNQDISGTNTISFQYLQQPNDFLYIDFKEDGKKIKKVQINDKQRPIVFENEHLIIDASFLKQGNNNITIEFIAGNGALNRRDDFLYTLFVPDRARTVFPCFDQPDLKASFKLSLTIPQNWIAIANGRLTDSTLNGQTKTLNFANTEKLPTYLFSFAAGKFNRAVEPWNETTIELLYRETDSEKISNSLKPIFDQYKKYMSFYEEWTGIPYPFQKHGMVAIPDFQFGGMEHPGAILLQQSTLFLTKDATEGQLNSRQHLLAHEVAHMWFGDLVTMNWFTDVWMKEVFANFMADKATATPNHEKGYALKFLTDHLPPAYGVDRTTGANPIRQPLDNLENAGTLYGNIIYHKSPVMMRQLEQLMGEPAFQTGVRAYLKNFSYNNASWPDLIKLLDQQTPLNLQTWNTVWVNEPGRPVFDYLIAYQNNAVSDFFISQKPEYGTARVWPQSFDVCFYYNGLIRNFNVNDSLPNQSVNEALERKKPLFIQFNASGIGYGVWPVDTAMYAQLYAIDNYVSRASAYINLYENMLIGRYKKADELLDFFTAGLKQETVELNLRLLTGYIESIYWRFLKPDTRKAKNQKLEEALWMAIQQQKTANNRKILFGSYQNIFESPTAQKRLLQIWKQQKPPFNIILKEEDYTSLAFALQLRADYPEVLEQQLTRIENADRKKRFEIIKPALSFDAATRDAFFAGLLKKENRRNESAIGTALSYFHHPLRQPSAEKYLMQTLEAIPEIQKTGDIFFPTNWLQSSLGSYQSASANKVVEDYLAKNSKLSANLKAKILQATDNLKRAQSIVR